LSGLVSILIEISLILDDHRPEIIIIKTKRPTEIKKGQFNLTSSAGLTSHAGAQPPYLNCWPLLLKRRRLWTPPYTGATYQENSLIFMSKFIIIVL